MGVPEWLSPSPSPSPGSSRHRGNREAAQELLERLRDNLELQRFLQKAQEVLGEEEEDGMKMRMGWDEDEDEDGIGWDENEDGME